MFLVNLQDLDWAGEVSGEDGGCIARWGDLCEAESVPQPLDRGHVTGASATRVAHTRST